MNVCEANGGLYVKLGQAIGVQAAILPKPYHALSKMFDDAERMPFSEVKLVVEKELGKKLTEVREHMEED
jgi:aarF domain-containing kinase